MIKKLLILPLLILIISCGGNKDTRPEWVKNRPIDNNNYIGIGIAQKKIGQSQGELLEEAKRNALNDLSSEISVKISSSSILHTMDLGNSFNEDYRSQIKTSSNASLDNYQMMGTYQGQSDYWVYYKINKREYQSTQNRKKNTAISKGKDFYRRGNKQKDNYNYKQAIITYINALESLREYWGEGLETTINGSKIFLGNEIINSINDIVNSIKIDPYFENIDIKRGEKLDNNIVKFIVESKTGNPLSDMPIFFYYSGRPVSNSKKYSSNSNGITSFNLGKISSKKNREYFQANLNLIEIVRKNTKDPLISKLVAKISTPQGKIELNIHPPSFYIESEEKNLRKKSGNDIFSIVENHLIKKDIAITQDKSEADFILKIKTDTKKGEKFKSTGLSSVNFIGSFEVFNKKGKSVYNYRLTKIKGIGSNFEDAGYKCYENAKREIKYKVADQIYRGVFN